MAKENKIIAKIATIYYYCYNSITLEITSKTTNISETTFPNIGSLLDIPIEFARIADLGDGNGINVYDSRNLSYWKTLKLKELNDKYEMRFTQGFETSILVGTVPNQTKLKVGIDKQTIDDLLRLKCIAEETTNSVIFEDFNGITRTQGRINIKLIFKEAAEFSMNLLKDKNTLKKSINNATTVEQIQAIVINP